MRNGDEVSSTYMQSVVIYVCSGTMLTNQWAIGCSHCYATELDNRLKEMFVYYDGKKQMVVSDMFGLFKQKQRIVELVRHPSNTAGGNPYYRKIQGFDITLFKLENPLTINGSKEGFEQKIWDGESSELHKQNLMCVGWGMLTDTQDSMVLRKAILTPEVKLEEVVAGARVGDRLHVLPNAKKQITMPGDSGCGCYVERNGIWYLASINAGGGTGYGFSMSVAHPEIRNWIRNVVFSEASKPLSNVWKRFEKEEVIKSAPAAASWKPGRLDVFARSQDNRLIQKTYEGGWTQWKEPKLKSNAKIPTLIDAPAAVSWGTNRIDCFVRGIDSRMYHLWYGNEWLDIESFDGIITSAPTAASWASGRLDIFALNQNGRLTHKVYDSGWKPWDEQWGSTGVQNLNFVDAPAAVSWGPNRLDCFMRGVDSRMHHIWYDNGWGKLDVFDGIIASAPAVASQKSGQLDVFARGLNNHLMHKRFDDGKWHPWTDLGGQTADSPAAVSWADKRLDCFVRGNDGFMYHDWSS